MSGSGLVARSRVVALGDHHYRESDWRAAWDDAFMVALARVLPVGASPRATLRALAGLRRPDAHRAVLRDALTCLTIRTPYSGTAPTTVVATFTMPA